ncbi:nitroreductase family protein [Desulfurispirillum indicum]|uniref:Nitroreductase n=1 Tax=Desulfurispirillum indicum (strain ATCC BAA-1389 / DSM 22839 / S5) TaxID=653733 RepID=E6W150_DESIS|nr:nitroreductase family protein [Desulfurispirillum indicum]ADU66470.1 nitroreductase [Desulfurispirillum indicum S5]UCZ55806.1 nitroreductase family protein [Desulfurispirillum indicum]
MFMETLRSRRSIRKFTPAAVEKDKIDLIMEAALRAPSSRGKQPWQFYCVQNKAIIDKLSRSKEHGAAFLAGAPLAVVICADPSISDVWIEDTSIAAICIQLAAQSIGLGSTWVQIRERFGADKVPSEELARAAAGIPENLKVTCIIGIGYPAETPAPWPFSALPASKVQYL